jgi:hypothetical protein
MKYLTILICISVISIQFCDAESLWDTAFPGYLSKTSKVEVGDIVTVAISSDFSLSFVSTTVDSKLFTLEFSGGEYPDLFSFMPIAKSGNQSNLRTREDQTFKSDVVARITRVISPNQAAIAGTKSITIDGKSESVTITGIIDPGDIGTDKKIDFSKVADSRLILKTLVEPASNILTNTDIQEVISGLSTGALAPGETPLPGAALQTKKFALTDAKKKELFLRYVNKIIDLIF